MQNETQCLNCKADLSLALRNVRDTRFGIEGSYDICQCMSCGLEQTIPTPSSDELKRLYNIYYNFGGEKDTAYTSLRDRLLVASLYRAWLIIDGDITFHRSKGSGRLLDIGCNEGRGLEVFRKNGFEVEGLEFNETAAAVTRAKGFIVHTKLLEQFQSTRSYDVTVLSNVLEHSLDPKGMLFHVHRILKTGGQAWISCPNSQSWLRFTLGRFWINWHVPFHTVHFSPGTLRRLLHESGFAIAASRQETPALWVAQSLIAFLFAKHGQPTRQLRNPLLIAFLILLVRGFLFPFLWVGNRLSAGDCLVVLARKM